MTNRAEKIGFKTRSSLCGEREIVRLVHEILTLTLVAMHELDIIHWP